MMARILQRTSFGVTINYALNREEVKVIASCGIRDTNIDAMINSFEIQARLNPITKPVAHISLNFSAQDRDKLTDKVMVGIAKEYLEQMGYGNTQVLMVRHYDREHPHLHMIINRIDFNGNRISDQNEKLRNKKICKELTIKHGLYFSSGKENVNRQQLREPDKTKYMIYDSLMKNVPLSKSWKELEQRLKSEGITIDFKTKGSTSQVEGVRFTANNLTFNGSKVDKQFSYSKIDLALKQNAQSEQQTVSTHQDRYIEKGSSLFLCASSSSSNNPLNLEEEDRRYRKRKKKNRGLKR